MHSHDICKVIHQRKRYPDFEGGPAFGDGCEVCCAKRLTAESIFIDRASCARQESTNRIRAK